MKAEILEIIAQHKFDHISSEQAVSELLDLFAVINWVAFDWDKIETHPTEYGKYLICRKDGKIHWETWNGNGWAYNHNEIRFWSYRDWETDRKSVV